MSVDAIKKFLEGVIEYGDDTPITIAGQQIPLGSLRQLNSSERQRLADGIKGLETREADLRSKEGVALDLTQKAQKAYDAAQEALKSVQTAPPAAPGTDPFADPWLAPVKKALDDRDKRTGDIESQLKGLLNTVQQAVSIAQQREWQREFSGLNFGKREKKPTFQELLKYATDNKVVDSFGIPSISGAWNRMSETDRVAEAEAAAREKGREEGRMEALAARITPPGAPGAGVPPQNPPGRGAQAGPDKDILGDLYGDALKDPELRSLIEQAAGAGVM